MNANTIERNKKVGRPRGAAIRFPGIIADAKTLGVNPTTLYRTLIGAAGFDGLKSLRRRYDELLETKPRELRDYINANKAWGNNCVINKIGKALK